MATIKVDPINFEAESYNLKLIRAYELDVLEY